jgi:hypothetical protein
VIAIIFTIKSKYYPEEIPDLKLEWTCLWLYIKKINIYYSQRLKLKELNS